MPSTSVLGGPAPYWSTYSYDLTGNRLSEVQHDTAGQGQDTTHSYTYPAIGQPHPHASTGVTATAGGVSLTSAYGYDAAGNTTSRPQDGNEQDLIPVLTYEHRLRYDQRAANVVKYLLRGRHDQPPPGPPLLEVADRLGGQHMAKQVADVFRIEDSGVW